MMPHTRPRLRSLFLAAWLCASGASANPVFDDLAQARDLICSFRTSGQPPLPLERRTRDDDLMLIIEGIGVDQNTARVTSSLGVGARPAKVYVAETRVHIVEDVNESVLVTTVLDCENRKPSGDPRKCLRFSAVVSWHFDRAVHMHPDRSFLALPGSSYAGYCEPWNIE